MEFIQALEGWGIPIWILIGVTSVIVLSLLVEAIGKIFNLKIPVSIILAKPFIYFYKKSKEKKTLFKNMQTTLNNVNEKIPQLEAKYLEATEVIKQFNKHYDVASINERDKWMLTVNTDLKWAHDRAKTYDASVKELNELAKIVKVQQDALELNNKMTSELYKQATRTQILDFSHKLVNARKADKPVIFSREEFRKIRKSYKAYEKFLQDYGGTNGEVDDAMKIIREAEAGKLPNIEFLEDLRD